MIPQWMEKLQRERDEKLAKRQALLDSLTPQDWDAHVGAYTTIEGGIIKQAPFLDSTVRDLVDAGVATLFLNDGRILDLVYGCCGWRK